MWFLLIVATVLMASDQSIAAEGTEPAITLFLRNMSVAEEQTISFVCKASGSPMPKFTWYRDNKRIKAVNRQRYEIKPMPHGSVLRIEPVKARRDSGKFTCEAENDYGDKVQTSAFLHVYPVDQKDWPEKDIPQGYPRITVNPKLKSIEKGRNAIMKCEAEAPGIYNQEPIQIEWFKDKIPVDLTDPRLTKVDPGYLQIHNSMESDHGRYECVASNSKGVAYSFAAMLYVKVRRVPPHFTMPPKNVEISPYTNVNLTCVAVGSPMPKVKFRAGPIELTPEDEEHIGTNTLVLINVTESKNYTCVASSELGNIEHVVQVKVKAPGTPPKNVRAVALSPLTVLVKWDEPAKPNGIIKGYKIFYTLEPDLPITLWTTLDVPLPQANQRQATITELKPNKTYSLCVLAYSTLGEGPISDLEQVMTKPGVPGQPRNLHANEKGPNRIEVIWSPPDDYQHIQSYVLYYNDSTARQAAHVVIQPPTNNYLLEELIPDTIYHIQVSATSMTGEGPKSTIIQMKTPQFVPSAAPQAVTGQPVSKNSIKVTWKPPPVEKHNGEIEGYRIYFRKNDSDLTDEDATTVKVGKDARMLMLGELNIWTDYMIWVLSFTSVGDGPPSPTIIVRTQEDVPGEPKSVKVDVVNSTCLFVEWKPPVSRRRNGIIRGYYVYFIPLDDNDNPKGQEKYYDTKDGSIVEAVITELDPNTFYRITVAGYTRKGDGERSEERKIKTSGPVPSEPRNFDVELVNAENPSVSLTWQKPAHVPGTLKHFKVSWGRKGELIYTKTLSYSRYSFGTDKLDKGATYEFRVQAVNENGVGHRAVKTLDIPDGVPAGAPQNFTVTGVSETTIRLEWDLPAKHLQNGEIVMYQMIYHKLAEIDVEDLNLTSTEFTIRGLDMNTDYVFQIRAFTSKGAGPWTTKLIFHTYGRSRPLFKTLECSLKLEY